MVGVAQDLVMKSSGLNVDAQGQLPSGKSLQKVMFYEAVSGLEAHCM